MVKFWLASLCLQYISLASFIKDHLGGVEGHREGQIKDLERRKEDVIVDLSRKGLSDDIVQVFFLLLDSHFAVIRGFL